ncbi:uncharacterized protein BDZ99DRAFT_527840 [Mytilinidion resinicola]|uniref:Uncharacterized protein n=1 Tax=Mytilinidion resinicola TaxID=574789 RepID=A0A6A6Y033_9PEZI|nr:uncharacterized protein BDZ99DRAFT_527840 [Mytilinidion resinicola]KAF2802176.1 hypothetical protein BDZ99DRAFT_527840 [Mytilinidion resinicola]
MSATNSTNATAATLIDPQIFLEQYPGFDDIRDINDIAYNARVCRGHIEAALAYFNDNRLTAEHFASAAGLRKPEAMKAGALCVPDDFSLWLAAQARLEQGADIADPADLLKAGSDPKNPTPEQRMAMDAFCERLILSWETFLQVYDHTQRANGDYPMPRFRYCVKVLRNACAHKFLVPGKHLEFVEEEGQDRLTSVVQKELPELNEELKHLIVLLESLVPFIRDKDDIPDGVELGWALLSSWPNKAPQADDGSANEVLDANQGEDGESQIERSKNQGARWYRRLRSFSHFHWGKYQLSTTRTSEEVKDERLGNATTMTWDPINESSTGSKNNPPNPILFPGLPFRHPLRIQRNNGVHHFLVPHRHWAFVEDEGQKRLADVVQSELPELDKELEDLMALFQSLVPLVKDSKDEPRPDIDDSWSFGGQANQNEAEKEHEEQPKRPKPRWYHKLYFLSVLIPQKKREKLALGASGDGGEFELEQYLQLTMSWNRTEASPEEFKDTSAKSGDMHGADDSTWGQPECVTAEQLDDEKATEDPKPSFLHRSFDLAMRSHVLRRGALKARNFLYEELQGVDDID